MAHIHELDSLPGCKHLLSASALLRALANKHDLPEKDIRPLQQALADAVSDIVGVMRGLERAGVEVNLRCLK